MSGPTLTGALNTDQWLLTVVEAFNEVATTSLACVDVQPAEHDVPPADLMSGAYVPLMSDQGAIQVGLIASEEDCTALARALLGMEPGDPLELSEVADAVGEIVNMMAGVVQRKLAEHVTAALGLPIFFRGGAVNSEHIEVVTATVVLADVNAKVTIVRSRKG